MSNVFLRCFADDEAAPLVISSVTGDEAWHHFIAASGHHESCDAVELRLDTLPSDIPTSYLSALHPDKPVLLTLRHADEGGAVALDSAERVRRVRELLPIAAAVDWEIAKLREEGVPELIDELREKGIALIASAHDFEATPTLGAMREAVIRARRLGADCVKFAFTPLSEEDIALGSLLLRSATAPVAAMGMGHWGTVSRLLYSQLGSKLIYCSYSGCEAAVPGQIPDTLAKQLISLLPRG